MARLNVYVPDGLADAAREARLNVSRLTQDVLSRELSSIAIGVWLRGLPPGVPEPASTEQVLVALRTVRGRATT